VGYAQKEKENEREREREKNSLNIVYTACCHAQRANRKVLLGKQ
jgi:hypothetical protein